MRDAGGHGYKFRYDDANRLVRRTGRMGFTFYFEYDAQGRCTKSWGDGRIHEVTLDYEVPAA